MINKSVAYTIYGVSDVLLPCRCNHSCTPICLGTAVQCCPERLAEAFCCTCGQPMPTCKCRGPFWLQMITGRLVWQHVVWYKLQVFRFKGLNFAAVHNFTNVHNLSPMFWVILLLTNMVQHEFVPTSCDILRHLATSCIFGMPLRAKLRLCLNTILTPTASIADVLSVFKRYHTVRCFKSFRGLRLRKMELAFTGLNPVTKEVQREDQRYSHTCTYTASKPLHCESCTYTWQSQAVNLDKHVLLHLGVCLGLSQQSNRGNMQQTFFAILLLLARSKNVPSNRSNKPMDQHHKSWEMCPCPSYRGHSGHRTCRITFCVDFWPRIRVATLTMHPNAIQALSWTRPPDGRRRHAKSTLS